MNELGCIWIDYVVDTTTATSHFYWENCFKDAFKLFTRGQPEIGLHFALESFSGEFEHLFIPRTIIVFFRVIRNLIKFANQ